MHHPTQYLAIPIVIMMQAVTLLNFAGDNRRSPGCCRISIAFLVRFASDVRANPILFGNSKRIDEVRQAYLPICPAGHSYLGQPGKDLGRFLSGIEPRC